MYENFGLFIKGEWRRHRGAGAIGVIDPATGETIAQARRKGGSEGIHDYLNVKLAQMVV